MSLASLGVTSQVSAWVEKKMASLSPRAGSPGADQSPASFGFTLNAATSGGDALTVAAALALLPAEESGSGLPLLPDGWRPLAQRARQLLQPAPAGAAEPSAAVRGELAQLQLEVQRYLTGRVRDATDMESLLATLCTADRASGGSGILPAYRLATRPAPSGTSTGDLALTVGAPEREMHRVQLTSEDVTATDALLVSSSGILGKRFDLQKCLWGCAALQGGPGEERREVSALPQWLAVTLKREPNKGHFALFSPFEVPLGPDLEQCAAIQLREAGGKLAAYELRLVLATDRDRHHHAFFWVPRGAAHPAAPTPGWHSYGIFSDGRLAPAGGQRGWPDLLDSHMDEDPANIECLMFRRKVWREPSADVAAAVADLPLAADAAGQNLAALSQAVLSGFASGLDLQRLQQYAEGAGLASEGRRAALEARVRERLQGEMDGCLAILADTQLAELQAQCEGLGLEREGSADELKLRLALLRLQERVGLA